MAGQDAPASESAQPATRSELQEVRTVYLLPMAHGFDQFLASRLTRGGAVQVVADPAKADAILTDRLDLNLERKLDELYPPPAEPAESKTDEKNAEEKTAETAEAPSAKFADEAPPVRVSSFSRGKGTLFLVSTQSRSVLWSTFEKSGGAEPQVLNKMADRVVSRFEREIKPKPVR